MRRRNGLDGGIAARAARGCGEQAKAIPLSFKWDLRRNVGVLHALL